jgi:hypothetical protein
MDGKRSASVTADFDLTAGDCAIAQDADSLIIQRIPFSAQIGCLQNGESFFGQNRFIHFGKQPETKAWRVGS